MTKILIADDHPIVLLGTKTLLENEGYKVVHTCSNGLEAYNFIITRTPDIAVLDISMPGMTGLEILEKAQQNKVPTRIVILTLHNEISVFNKAKALGVSGFLLKEFAMEEIQKCLEEVGAGRKYFSRSLEDMLIISKQASPADGTSQLSFAENKIIGLIAQQKSTKEIAKMLFISEKTVETHRSNIIRKLNLPQTKNALLIWAMKNLN